MTEEKNGWQRYWQKSSIQRMIGLAFTLVSISMLILMGVLLYFQFANVMRQTILKENQQLVNQISLNINNYCTKMRGICNSMAYDVFKKVDLSNTANLPREMSLLFDANSSSLVSIACYDTEGNLVAAAPNSNVKSDVDVTTQEWFSLANTVIENPHFSTPHVQNLFEDTSLRYHWVISLSQMVELTENGKTRSGVVLVDMNYSSLEIIFQQTNADSIGYCYLIDPNGEIVYHPKQKLIYSGLFKENNIVAAGYRDGIYEETFDGSTRQVIVKTTSYTGWKVVSVIPNQEFASGLAQIRLFVITIIGLSIIVLIFVNSAVSSRVTQPIKLLDQSVKELEKGQLDLNIYVGGPTEVEHLGRTIRSTVDQIRHLMDDIVYEQELKRHSEFDALQAQINPHFLYNTLDSIVWMIESEEYPEAIQMVTSLASLFRISLSRGQTIIPIRSELQHAQSYLDIQKFRYKSKFEVITDIDPAILDYPIIKLVIQPLLENAIYHAMEVMDGDGLILLKGYKKADEIILEVIDNGLGIPPERLEKLLDPDTNEKYGSKGSGIGLKNVDQRLRLYYGEDYGIELESELDVGTTVRIRIPAQMTGFDSEAEYDEKN